MPLDKEKLRKLILADEETGGEGRITAGVPSDYAMSEDKPLSERVRGGEFITMRGHEGAAAAMEDVADEIAALEAENRRLREKVEGYRTQAAEIRELIYADASPAWLGGMMGSATECFAFAKEWIIRNRERVAELEKDHNKSLCVGEYTVIAQDNGGFWIAHESGEGMQTPDKQFEGLISEYYQREF
jgi:hypothetical protein